MAFPRFPDFEGRRPEEGIVSVAFTGNPKLAFFRPPDFEGRDEGTRWVARLGA